MAQKKITDLTLRSSFDATCNVPVDDTTQSFRCTGTQIAEFMRPLMQKSSLNVYNLGLVASVGTNALTVAVKNQAGSNASSSDPCLIGFRSATLTSGGFEVRSITGALSVVVSSGSTLGTSNGVAAKLNVYAMDNAGTVELGICNGILDEGSLQTSVAEGGAGAADSANVLYSTTARSNIPVRLIGRIIATEATAGTWATTPSEVVAGSFEASRNNLPFQFGSTVETVGVSTLTGGALFASSGGTPTNLNYYEEGSFTANFNASAGASGSGTSFTCGFIRVGSMVILQFPDMLSMTAGATDVAFATASGTLPSRLRPTVYKKHPVAMKVNNSLSNVPGYIEIDTDGTIKQVRDLVGTAQFTSGQGNNGANAPTAVVYSIL